MTILFMLPGAFFVPIIHNWAKAAMSASLGDPTPKDKGFLSGKPLKYFEIIGFVLMLMFGYGWGQPVPTSPLHYKDRRNGVLLTHLVPSAVSLLVGVIVAASLGVLDVVLAPIVFTEGTSPITVQTIRALFTALYHFARLSVGMAFFALLPVHPLNGARILQLFLKPELIAKMNQYEKIFQVLLIILLALQFIPMLLNPLVESIVNIRFVTRLWVL
jgi:Zn-dependent protease